MPSTDNRLSQQRRAQELGLRVIGGPVQRPESHVVLRRAGLVLRLVHAPWEVLDLIDRVLLEAGY